MYTQCPHCDTLFRIQATDLRAAQGKVRCGHCAQIFNALRFLSEELPEIPTVSETVEPLLPEIESADIAADEPHSTEELLGLVDKLVSELEPVLSPVEGPAPSLIEGLVAQAPPEPEPMSAISADEAPLLSEITEYKPVDVDEPFSLRTHLESGGTPFSIVEPPAGIAEEIAAAAERARAAQAQQHSGLSTLSWSAAILALAAMLAGQYVYYMRAELSQNAALRPWLERYCGVVEVVAPCELPLLREIVKIEIQNRELRAHPAIHNALQARLTLVNRADFAQPYPDLQLTLSDLGGQHFAQRRFHPAEYLSPGNDIAQGMPRNVEVPIAMEIAAPFDPVNIEASSWSFKLY